MMKIGVLPLCRPTFDVAYARERLAQCLEVLEQNDCRLYGRMLPLMDSEQASREISRFAGADIDRILVLQLTFTDASTVSEVARKLTQPISIWSSGEPRTGGRLRLNSFCGMNLASHALSLSGRGFAWLYAHPKETTGGMIRELLTGEGTPNQPKARFCDHKSRHGRPGEDADLQFKIGRIGEYPDGFATCEYDGGRLRERFGVSVEEFELDRLFERAGQVPPEDVESLRESLRSQLAGLDDLDQESLAKSLRLKLALEAIQGEEGLDGLAIRCWPEAFTEFGGAVCGPASILAESGVPCACEADVYGSVSQLLMQQISVSPVFLADIVDFDVSDDTAVLWHCGQAPVSMRDPDAELAAAIHSNRRMPLLFEFPLRKGTATIMRLSRAFGEEKLVMARVKVMRRPLAFAGTAAVVRFTRSAGDVMTDLISAGLEHHVVFAYGDHREKLRDRARELSLPLLEL